MRAKKRKETASDLIAHGLAGLSFSFVIESFLGLDKIHPPLSGPDPQLHCGPWLNQIKITADAKSFDQMCLWVQLEVVTQVAYLANHGLTPLIVMAGGMLLALYQQLIGGTKRQRRIENACP